MRTFLKSYVVILLGALITASPAFGQTSLGLTAGSGKDAKMGAISLSWPWDKKWFAQGDWYLGGYWQAELSYWRGDGDEPENNIAGLGFAPVNLH